MKRDGYVIEEIIEQSNLEDSFDTVVRGTLRKELREGKWLIAHREEFLAGLKQEIISGKVNLSEPHEKDIIEGDKLRHIQVFNMASRIKVNAVMTVVDKRLRKRYIRTTAASIKGRGMHDLKAHIERDMKMHSDIRHWYKADIRKFYDTVCQDFVMYAIKRVFKDKRLIAIMEQFVRLLPDGIGMSMGLRASQGVCNLLLSVFLDHYIKDRYGVKYYYRYCDDIVIGADSKLYLWCCRDIVHEHINGIKQEIKPSERVSPIGDGIDFLGYVIYPTHSMMRKRIKKNFARKLKRVKSRKRRKELVGSLWGVAKHCKSTHLMKKLLYPREFNKIKKKINKMKNFSELHVSYVPADGKKRFPNKATQLRSLVNVKIEVLDFERDIETKYGKRWLVMFRDTRTNEISKFFTDCDEMKQALDTLEGMKEIPFATVIGVEFFGDNKVKYKFT